MGMNPCAVRPVRLGALGVVLAAQRRARAPVRDTHASTHRTRVKVITYAARSSSGIRDKLSLHATRSLSHNARPSRIAGALHDASLSLNVCHGLGDVEELRERRSASGCEDGISSAAHKWAI